MSNNIYNSVTTYERVRHLRKIMDMYSSKSRIRKSNYAIYNRRVQDAPALIVCLSCLREAIACSFSNKSLSEIISNPVSKLIKRLEAFEADVAVAIAQHCDLKSSQIVPIKTHLTNLKNALSNFPADKSRIKECDEKWICFTDCLVVAFGDRR